MLFPRYEMQWLMCVRHQFSKEIVRVSKISKLARAIAIRSKARSKAIIAMEQPGKERKGMILIGGSTPLARFGGYL